MGNSANKVANEDGSVVITTKEEISNKKITLLEAAEDNDVEALQRIFEEKIDSVLATAALFTLRDSTGRTPMHLVAF